MLDTLPTGVLQDFYRRNQKSINMPYEDFMKKSFDTFDDDDVKEINNHLFDNYYAETMDRGEYDEASGYDAWKDTRPGPVEKFIDWSTNVAKGVGERSIDLGAGMLELADIGFKSMDLEDDGDTVLGEWAESLRGIDLGYEAWTTWDEVKENPMQAFAFAFEQGIVSAPDMAMALINLPTYIGMRTGELAQERSVADGLRETKFTDLIAALPTATASALLERIGARAVTGMPGLGAGGQMSKSGAQDVLLDLPAKKSVGSVAAKAGKAGVTEAITEAGQEGLEYTGTHAGTSTGWDAKEMLVNRMAAGAVAGGIFGGAVGGATGTAQVMQGETQEELHKKLQDEYKNDKAEREAEAEQELETEIETEPEQSQDSVDRQAEADEGIRAPIEDVRAIKPGDLVSFSPVDRDSVIGEAQPDEETGLVNFYDKEGNILGSYDPQNPRIGDKFYTPSEQEKEDWKSPTGKAPTPEEQEFNDYGEEVLRLIERSQQKPDSEQRIKDLDRARKDKKWNLLTPEIREQVDNLIEAGQVIGESVPPATPPSEPASPETQPTSSEEAGPSTVETEGGGEPVPVTVPETEAEGVKPPSAEVETGPTEVEPGPAAEIPYKPQVEPLGERKGEPRTAKILWDNNRKEIDVEYAVVELDDVIESHDQQGGWREDYPRWKQPRDRNTKASITRTRERMASFDPSQPTAIVNIGQTGAPMIDKTGVVESGNGRMIAIRGIYDENMQQQVESYKSELKNKGFDIEGVNRPVLVRVRQTDMSQDELKKFIKDMNTSVEETNREAVDAGSDADRITPELLDTFEDDFDVDAQQNSPFINRYLSEVVPSNIRDKFLTDSGSLTEAGARRIRLAMIQRAFGSKDLTEMFFTENEAVRKTLANVLGKIAPRWAKYSDAIKDGRLSEAWDVNDTFKDLINDLGNYYIKKAGDDKSREKLIDEINRSDELLSNEPNPVRVALANLFFAVNEDGTPNYKRLAGQEEVARKLKMFAAVAESETDALSGQGTLFGPEEDTNRDEVVEFLQELAAYDHKGLIEVLKDEGKRGLNRNYSARMMTALELTRTLDEAQLSAMRFLREKFGQQPQAASPNMPDSVADSVAQVISNPEWDNEFGFLKWQGNVDAVPTELADKAVLVTAWVGNNPDMYESLIQQDRNNINTVIDTWAELNKPDLFAPQDNPETPPEEAVIDEDINDDGEGSVPIEQIEPLVEVEEYTPPEAQNLGTQADEALFDETEDLINSMTDDIYGDISGGVKFSRGPGNPTVTNIQAEDLLQPARLSNERLTDVIRYLAERVKLYATQVQQFKRQDKKPPYELAIKFSRFTDKYRMFIAERDRRKDHDPKDSLPGKYKVELRYVADERIDENGERQTDPIFKLFNLKTSRTDEHVHLNGLNNDLRNAMPDLGPDPLVSLGGELKMISESTAGGDKKLGYEFKKNPFSDWKVVEALGLEAAPESIASLIADAAETEVSDALADFDAVSQAPKISAEDTPQPSTVAFIERGKEIDLEQEVMDNQIDDAVRIVRAWKDGKKGFVLATPTGSGKTFMLGAAMNELLHNDPELNFLYVSKNAGLHSQAKGELAPVLKEQIARGEDADTPTPNSIRMLTYPGIRNKTNEVDKWVNDKTVIIFDEGHAMMNIRSQTMGAAYEFVKGSNFNILASATPFTNPSTAQYLQYLGIFEGHLDQMTVKPDDDDVFNEFHDLAKQFGASVDGGPKSTEAMMDKEEIDDKKHPMVTPKVNWRTQKGVREKTVGFLNWLVKSGVYMTRKEALGPATLTTNEFENVRVDLKHIGLYKKIEAAYDVANEKVGKIGGSNEALHAHGANLLKRIAEGAKIETAATRAVLERYLPTELVDYTGKGKKFAKQSKSLRNILDAYNNRQEEGDFKWRSMIMNENSNNIGSYEVDTANGTVTYQLNSQDYVTFKTEERSVVLFIDTKSERQVNWLKVSSEKDPKQFIDRNETGRATTEEKEPDWNAQRYYSPEEVLDYFEWYTGQPESYKYDKYGRPMPGRYDFTASKFAGYQFALAGAYKELGFTVQQVMPSMKQTLADKLIERGVREDEIGFYTGDESVKARKQTKKEFNDLKKDFMIVTMAAGGTGLSLHDVNGNRPRTLIGTILPWEAITTMQVLGRVSRLGMKSEARVKWLIANDFDVEMGLSRRLSARLDNMGYSTTGRVPKVEGSIGDILNSDLEEFVDEDVEGSEAVSQAAQTIMSKGNWRDLADLQDSIENTSNSAAIAKGGMFLDSTADRNRRVAPHVQKALSELMHRLSPKTQLRVQKYIDEVNPQGITEQIAGHLTISDQDVMNSIITIAENYGPAYSYQPVDMKQTLGHELFHAMRQYGLMTDKEYAAVMKYAVLTNAREKYNIDKRYKNESEDVKQEEAAAEMFGDYVKARESERGNMFTKTIRDVFERIIMYFRQVAEYLGIYDPDGEEVFKRIYKGKVGRREIGDTVSGSDAKIAKSGTLKKRVAIEFERPSDKRMAITQYVQNSKTKWNGQTNPMSAALTSAYSASVGRPIAVKANNDGNVLTWDTTSEGLNDVPAVRITVTSADKAAIKGTLRKLGQVPQIPLNNPSTRYENLGYHKDVGYYFQGELNNVALNDVASGGELQPETMNQIQKGRDAFENSMKSELDVIFTSSGAWVDFYSGKVAKGEAKLEDNVSKSRVKKIGKESDELVKVGKQTNAIVQFVSEGRYKRFARKAKNLRTLKTVEEEVMAMGHDVYKTESGVEVEPKKVDRGAVAEKAFRHNNGVLMSIWNDVENDYNFWFDDSPGATALRQAYVEFIGDVVQHKLADTFVASVKTPRRDYLDGDAQEMLGWINESYKDIITKRQSLRNRGIFSARVGSVLNKSYWVNADQLIKAIDKKIDRSKSIDQQIEQATGLIEKAYDANETAMKVLDRVYEDGYAKEQNLAKELQKYMIDNGVYAQYTNGYFYTEVGMIRLKDHPLIEGRGWSYGLPSPDKEVIFDRRGMADDEYVENVKQQVIQKVEELRQNPVPKDDLYFLEPTPASRRPVQGQKINFAKRRQKAVQELERESPTIRYSKGRVESPYVEASNPEVEKRWQGAKGIDQPTMVDKIKDILKSMMDRTTRHRLTVDQSKVTGEWNAEYLEKARHLEATNDVAAESVYRHFARIAKGLSHRDYDLFIRAVVLPDLIYDAEQGLDVPFYDANNIDEIKQDLERVMDELNSNENVAIVKEKLDIHKEFLNDIRQRMIESGAYDAQRLHNPAYFHHQVIEYAQVRKMAAGGKGKVATPFMHGRKGTYKDINLDYFQSQAAFIYKAEQDIATAKFLNWLRKSKYNTVAEKKRKAVASNQRRTFTHLINDIHLSLQKMGAPANMMAKYDPKNAEFTHPIQLMRDFKQDLKDAKLLMKYQDSAEFEFTKKYDSHRMQIARYMNTLAYQSTLLKDEVLDKLPRDLYRQMMDSRKGVGNVDEMSPLMRLASWLSQTNDPDFNYLKMVSVGLMKEIELRRQLVANTLGDSYVNPKVTEQLFASYGSDSEAIWQADSFDGKQKAVHMYTAYTVPQHIFERANDHLIEALEEKFGTSDFAALLHGLKHGDMNDIKVNARKIAELMRNMREQTVVGGPKEQMILPDYLTEDLNNFRDPYIEGALDKIWVGLQSNWKRWILFMPWRIFKYNLNNTTSDIDAIIANRSAHDTMKHIPQAFKEIYGYLYKGETATQELKEALNFGVINSTLVAQEIPDTALRQLDVMEDGMAPDLKIKLAGQVDWNFVRKYFDTVGDLVKLREAGVRYAAYLNYRKKFVDDQLTLEDVGYGATPPWIAKGITSQYDLAARMARDAIGDYGNLGVNGRAIRQRAIPFWSFVESNFRRYHYLFRNAFTEGANSKDKGYAAVGLSVRALTRLFYFYAIVNMWNWLFFGDDEERLSPEQQMQLHLNLGEWGGKQTTLRFQGAMSEYLGWLNMEDAGAIYKEVQDGQATFSDIFTEMAKGPANKMAQGLTPFVKVPIELLTGKQFFPDIFKPYDIYDPYEHTARTFSLHKEYKAIVNYAGEPVPSEDYFSFDSVADAFVYRRQAGELQYNQFRRQMYQFREQNDNAKEKRRLYNARKKALAIGDYDTAKMIQRKLVEDYGATRKSLQTSHDRLSPQGMLTKKQRKQWEKTASPKQKAQLRQAEIYWRSAKSRSE